MSIRLPSWLRARPRLLALGALVTGVSVPHRAHADVCAPTINVSITNSVLKHPQVTLIFWGTEFSNAGRVGTQVGAFQDMMNGPYFSMLNQYGGAGMPQLSPNVVIKSDSDPPNPFKTSRDVGALVKSLQGSTIPAANPNVDNIYGVILSGNAVQAGSPADTTGSLDDVPRCRPPAGKTAGGCHTQGTANNGKTFVYAWAENHSRLTFAASPTASMAHELDEAIVDPYGGNTEIGDPCDVSRSCTSAVGGTTGDSTTGWYSVAGYYSALDGRCVTPRGWGGAMLRNASGGFDSTGAGPLRQAYASGAGIVASDNADPANLWALPAGSSTWVQIGVAASGSNSFASMYALTDNQVFYLAPDGSYAALLVGGGTWLPIATPPSGTVYTAIYAGGADLVALVDTSGTTSLYHNNNWTTFGRMSALALNQNGAYGLNVNHDTIQILPSGGAIAINTTLGYQNLFSSPVLLSTISGTSVWSWSDYYGRWYNDQSDGSGFLASTSWGVSKGDVFQLNTVSGPAQQKVAHLYPATVDPPVWTSANTSNNIGKLVNGGWELFALNQACPVYATKPSVRTPTCP